MADKTRPVLAGCGWVCDGEHLIQLGTFGGVPVAIREDLLPYADGATETWTAVADPVPLAPGADHYHIVVPVPLRIPRDRP